MDRTFGAYRLIGQMGRSVRGRLYLAIPDERAEENVVIRIYQETRLANWREVSEFLQAAERLKQLRHSAILPVLDAGVEKGVPYIVSAYAPGGSLHDRLKRVEGQRLPVQESARILSQIGQALAYAHEQGFVHGRVRPKNVLFNAEGEAQLANFSPGGWLAVSDDAYGGDAGQARYMAPEQFEGSVSEQSDQYALGCLAYELFAGRAPFVALAFSTLRLKHMSEAPGPLRRYAPDLPVHIEQAVQKALAKDPADRYETISGFVRALNVVGDTSLVPETSGAEDTAEMQRDRARAVQALAARRSVGDRGVLGKARRVLWLARIISCLVVLMTVLALSTLLPTTFRRVDSERNALIPVTVSTTAAISVPLIVPQPVLVATPEVGAAPTAKAVKRAASPVSARARAGSTATPVPSRPTSVEQPMLTASLTSPPDVTDLTAEGSIDWADWGLDSSDDFNHKNGVAQQISNYRQIGNGPVVSYSDNPNGYSWSDGTPTRATIATTTGIAMPGMGNGFAITVPASTSTRILKVYVGVSYAQGKLTAALSGTHEQLSDTTLLNAGGTADGVYTILYKAVAPGQVLTVTFTLLTRYSSFALVTWQAATLQ